MRSGIYYILNTTNGKIYIGSSSNVNKRLSEHKRQLLKNIHKNKKLQNSWNKYSEDSFEFGILEFSEKEKLIIREQFYLDTYLQANLDTGIFYEKGFNILRIAGNSTGFKMSIEQKEKISNSLKGSNNPFYGRVHSDDTKSKMSEKKMGILNPNYGIGVMLGKNHSDETKIKISKSNTGKNNKNSKKVYQYSKDGLLINEYESVGEASRILGFSQGNISSCCLGNQKTAYGFIWSY